jgi:hypothetical protein
LLSQSVERRHALPAVHLRQTVPPQSTSVSDPFRTVSEHVAVWHALPVHTVLWQSNADWHALPAAHFGHVPPQSRSVSFPFLTPSVHVGARQVPPVHTPVAQSVP